MSRRGIVEMVQASLKVPRGNAGYWRIICELDLVGPWSLTMIEDRSNVGRESIRDFVRRLVKGGFAEKVGSVPQRGSGKSPSTTYRLLKRPIIAPRLDRAGQERGETQRETMWRAMKMLGTFDAVELSQLNEAITREVASNYLVALHGVGVVARVDDEGKLRASRFRLVNNLGARAPVITKATNMVFDPNSGTVMGEPQLVEVSP